MWTAFLESTAAFLPLLLTVAGVGAGLAIVNRYLSKRWHGQPTEQFRFQLIMLGLTVAGLIAVVVALPVSESLRGQLLSLLGILLSAAIALSSTTFIGNIMAGLMLRLLGNTKPGDFITVADLTGRITVMDLLHTEIQTEQRDLVTVPNLHMVTQPTKVVRASGTIVSSDVSLGYDISHHKVKALLLTAIEQSGLKDGFVQLRDLGDFSVTYRASGLLEDVKSLLTARSSLRGAMLDVLHQAGLEIVSPSFMNTRSHTPDQQFVPTGVVSENSASPVTAEEVIFDKADNAASIEEIRESIEKLEEHMSSISKLPEAESTPVRSALQRRIAILTRQLAVAESAMREDGPNP